MMSLPIVFLHKGNQKYLSIAVKRALASGNTVYLLGDTSNRKLCSNWYDLESLNSDAIENFKHFYVHMSKNSREFELLCILRYFYLYEFMTQNNIPGIILVDSDCLVYKKYNSTEYASYDCAFGWNFDERPDYICPSSCYWTQTALKNFTDFCTDIYANHLNTLKGIWDTFKRKPGGICDITLLLLWLRSNPSLHIYNLMEKTDSLYEFVPAWDHDKQHRFQHYSFTKLLKIKFINKTPYLVCVDGQLQKVDNLHMHGGKKVYMALLSKHKSNGLAFYCLEIYRRLKWFIIQTYRK